MNVILAAAHGAAHDPGVVSGTLGLFTGLLAIAATVAITTRFVRIPYTVALVLAGLAVALLHAAPQGLVITEELVLVLFLPPLLFQAGLHMDLDTLRARAVPVTLLAVPGVIVATIAAALAIRWLLPEAVVQRHGAWLPALLLGAMLAPTDPISVLATFRTAGAPAPLKTIVEGESLFNDGTGVVLFLILRAAIFGGAVLSVGDGVVEFVRVAGLGLVVGLGFGLLAFWLLTRLDDHVLENAITVVLVWGSFIIAERLRVSGVIAVVVAGLIMGNYGSRLAMSQRTRETIHTFWESIDFIVNSIVFLLIGLELQALRAETTLWSGHVLVCIGAVFLAITAGRALTVYPMSAVNGRDWPAGWRHVLFWSGLKGSIPVALVLGLPAGDPLRAFLAPVVFGVVLLSLLLQGLTVPWLIRRTGVAADAAAPAGNH